MPGYGATGTMEQRGRGCGSGAGNFLMNHVYYSGAAIMWLRSVLFSGIIYLSGVTLWVSPAAAESGCTTAQCHGATASSLDIHPKEAGCPSCHVSVAKPHPQAGKKTFERVDNGLCLECHADTVSMEMKVLHGPLKTGDCTACHNPHGGAYGKLLVKQHPSSMFVNYSGKEYELCFSCHKRTLLMFPDTSFSTGFRDGDRNLHFLHVNRKKRGRNCTLCHTLHGGDLPRLVAGKVDFGKWRMPLHFKKTATGGGCNPGCHSPRRYDRKNQVNRQQKEDDGSRDAEKDGKKVSGSAIK